MCLCLCTWYIVLCVCLCVCKRDTVMVFFSPPACIILTGVTGIRLSLQNTFTALAPFVCVCVWLVVGGTLGYLHAINPALMKWKRLTGIKGLPLKDDESSVPLLVQEEWGRASRRTQEGLGGVGVRWVRTFVTEITRKGLHLLRFYNLMWLVWSGLTPKCNI